MGTLADLLFDADRAPSDPLVHWRDDTYSRAEIADAAQRLADTLRRTGAAPDSAVAALVPSTPLGLVTCFGIWRAGAVVAPLAARPPVAHPDGPESEPAFDPEPDPAFDRLVAEVRPSVVVRPSLDEASLVPQVVVRGGEPRHYDDAVALIATASAGEAPRRVLLTHAAVRASVAAAAGTLRDTGVSLVPVPAASGPGLDAALVAAATGGAVVLLDDPVPTAAYADAVRRFAVESAMITPELVAALVDDPVVTTLEPLRYARCVPGPPGPAAAGAFRARFGVAVLGGYTRVELGGEVAGWTVGDASLHGDVKLGSAGRAYPDVELRIVRDDRTDAAPDEPGEIWVRSPYAMVGDASDRLDLATRIDDDGFLHTGDRGRLDRDGFLWTEAPSARAEDPTG